MAKEVEKTVIEIIPPQMETVKVHIKGISPLIVHRWSEKAKKEILDKQMKKATKTKEAKNPVADFATALYWGDGCPDIPYDKWTMEKFNELAKDAKFGFPVSALKQCANTAAYRAGMVKNMMALRAAYFISGIGQDQLAIIETPTLPQMREDMVKVGMGTADIRYRPEFVDWGMTLSIRYNKNGPISIDQIINVLNLGGQTNGIGEWRGERDGVYGMFVVDG